MRSVIKQAAGYASLLACLPLLVMYYGMQMIFDRVSVFAAWSQFLSLLPGKSGEFIRAAFYRAVLPRFGADAVISFGALLSHPDTEIGSGTYIGPHCNIGKSKIANDCLLGSGVHILSGKGQHVIDDLDTPIRDQGGVLLPIEIGSDCWFGNASVVMADVGSQCVIGAASVVIRPLPARSIAAGNPAAVIRQRDDSADQTSDAGAPQ